MTEEQAIAEIKNIATKHNIYFVSWSGHFGHYIRIQRRMSDNSPEPGVYGAFLESYYDLVHNDEVCGELSFKHEEFHDTIKSYIDLLNLFKTKLTSLFNS